MHFYIVDCPLNNPFILKDGLYVCQQDWHCTVKDSEGIRIRFHIKKGFKTDGGSIPKCFQWFAPNWDNDNFLYCIAFILHDAMYGTEYMSKDLADDMMRGLLRDAGLSRFKASTMCWCVQHFADKYYGEEYDKWNCKEFVSLEIL